MAWSKFTDMAMTPQEQAEKAMVAPVALGDIPRYPYGLCISLDHDSLERLGLDHSDLEIGDLVDLRAMAKITSISENETEGGKSCRIEMQITHLATEVEDDETPEVEDAEHEDEGEKKPAKAKRRKNMYF